MTLKKMRIKILPFLVICLFTYCNKKRIGNDSFIVIKDGEGNLQSEIQYINDTIQHGLAKYYYYPNPKNVLKDEIEYNYGKKSGWHKHYRNDGTLESKTHWKNNVEDGQSVWYYDNKMIEQETYRINGVQYGSAYYYFPNGKLKLYNCIDSWGENIYVQKYDSLGHKIREEGLVYSPKLVVLYVNDTTQTPIVENWIKANEKIAIKMTVAQPPQTKTTIRMGELNKNMVTLPIENYTATYIHTFNTIGKNTILIAGEIKDMHGKRVKYDSTSVNLDVIK
jgi:hypothetical protein